MKYGGLKFRADTKVQGIRLAAVTPRSTTPAFPSTAFHWDSMIYADR